MRQATYRLIRFDVASGERFVGVAWNYKEAVLLSTTDCTTYTGARTLLSQIAESAGVELKWFDGSYRCVDDQIVPLAKGEPC